MAGFATKFKDILFLPTGNSSWKGIQLSEQTEPQPGHGLPGSQWGPPSPSLHLFLHHCPLSLPLSHLAGHPSFLSLPPPAPDAAIWLGVSSASTPLPPPGRDWVQLQPRSALGEVPRGMAVCVHSRDDGAGCSGGPGPLCPHGNLPKKAAPPLTN